MASANGVVTHVDGSPVVGATVVIYQRSLGQKVALEPTATTAADGSWTIELPGATLTGWLSAEVQGSEPLGVTAARRATGDLMDMNLVTSSRTARGPALFDRMDPVLSPLVGTVPLADLNPDDFSLLSIDTGFTRLEILRWLVARQLEAEVANPLLSRATLFGLVSAGGPPHTRRILQMGPVAVRRSLQSAVDANLLSLTYESTLETQVQNYVLVQRAYDAASTTVGSWGAFFSAFGFTAVQIETLVELKFAAAGDPESFWTALDQHPTFTSTERATTRWVVQLARLSLHHAPLAVQVASITGLDLFGLAGYQLSDWEALTAPLASVPAEVAGEDDAARKLNYATLLARRMERQHGSLVFRARLLAAFPNTALAAFLNLAPNFNFGRHIAETQVDALGGTLTWGAQTFTRDQVLAELKPWIRLYRCSPAVGRYPTAHALYQAGYRSAKQVTRQSAGAFSLAMAGSLSAEDADWVFRRAQRRVRTASHLATGVQVAVTTPTALGLADSSQLSDSRPPATGALFTSSGLCGCEACRSLLSPAAYLVDLLAFLEEEGAVDASGEPTVLNAFRSRRPDVTGLLLTCANTHTEVPQVDLVIEVLEHVVVQEAPSAYTTTGRAEDLAAMPENATPHAQAAYSTLREALYPPSLPYDFYVHQLQVYGTDLGLDRLEAVRIAHAPVGTTSLAAAFVQLGLTWHAGQSLTEPQAELPLWGGPSSLDVLGVVGTHLLPRGDFRFMELLDLLHTRTVNPTKALAIVVPPGVDPCDLDQLTLAENEVTPTEAAFAQIRRFLRLQRSTGWSIPLLDELLQAVSGGVIDEAALVALGQVDRARALLALPVDSLDRLAAWWGPLPAHLDRAERESPRLPLFERVFVDRTRYAAEESPFRWNPDRTALENHGELLANWSPDLQAALGLDAASGALLLDDLGRDGITTLSADNLAQAFRRADLAQALGLSLADALAARSLLGVDPFIGPAQLEAFVQRWTDHVASGFSLAEVRYLLTHADEAAATVGPTEADLRNLLGPLRAALLVARQDVPDPAQPDAVPQGIVVAHLANATGLDTALLEPLLLRMMTSNGLVAALDELAAGSWIDALIDQADPYADLTEVSHPEPFQLTEQVLALADLVQRWSLTWEALSWLLDQAHLLGWADLLALPRTSAGGSVPFAAWQTTVWAAGLERRLPGTTPSVPSLFGLLDGPGADPLDPFLTDLAARTGWSFTELANIATHHHWTTLGDLVSPSALEALFRTAELAAACGLTTGQLLDAGAEQPTDAAARAVLDASRTRHQLRGTWTTQAPKLRDTLRRAQQAALVTRAVDVLGLDDANALYSYLVLDVATDPFVKTTRVVMATASVQQFVQRVLLGLHENLSFADEERVRRQWPWRRAYRLWEAARKVFLWPENWAEPELRDDKSTFFRDWETALEQGDLSDEAVEVATTTYLESLHEVANLEVVGVYRQGGSQGSKQMDDPGVLHVLARTRSAPRSWWYRTKAETGYWTPWEAVPLEIPGDEVLITVVNERVRVVWLIKQPSADAAGEQTIDVRLGWSERRAEAWGPAQSSLVGWQFPAKATVTFNYWLDEESTEPPRILTQRRAESASAAVARPETDGIAFSEASCSGSLEASEWAEFATEVFPFGMYRDGQHWSVRVATLSVHLAPLNPGTSGDVFPNDRQDVPLLETAPVDSRVAFSVQRNIFASQDPFFVHCADGRSYLVDAFPAPFAVRPEVFEGPLQPLGESVADQSLSRWDGDLLRDNHAPAGEWEDLTFAHSDLDQEHSELGPEQEGPSGSSLLAISHTPEVPSVGAAHQDDSQLYRFERFYHPYVCTFLSRVREDGLEALLAPPDATDQSAPLSRQQLSHPSSLTFEPYAPTSWVATPYPNEQISFQHTDAYGLYNWELFFHGPWLVSRRLQQDLRFEEALRWLRYLYDPTSRNQAYPIPQRYWKVRPLLEEPSAGPIDNLLVLGAGGGDSPLSELELARRADFEASVEAWEDEPFNPHLLCRLRSGSYQRAIVLRHLDLLLAWGDHLFRQDTRETINEATQLYVLATDLLGPAPEDTPPLAVPPPKSFDDLMSDSDQDLGAMRDPLVDVETLIDDVVVLSKGRRVSSLVGQSLYFCVPRNPRWDELRAAFADRLFKIRNGLNLDGVRRSLSLWAPPIDPAQIVAAVAGGASLSAALASTAQVAVPLYRFETLLAKARQLAGTVQALGGALLSALEKRDSAALQMLRTNHESSLLSAVSLTRKTQVREADEQVLALTRSLELALQREKYYAELLDKGLLPSEEEERQQTLDARKKEQRAERVSREVSYFEGAPQFIIPFGGKPEYSYGSMQAIAIGRAAAEGARVVASKHRHKASLAAIRSGRQRRKQEWEQQQRQAQLEIKQLETQIEAARLRVEISQREVDNQELQVTQSRAVLDFLSTQFPTESLYQWQVGQLSSLYFQAYQLAVDLAKKAERAWQHELGEESTTFIQFGHWDALRQGLLAGERLQADLDRLETAWLDNHQREFEVTQHISLSDLDPAALMMLRTTGNAWFRTHEALFDAAFPGHYRRRIKSVALSIPCVTGPQGGVYATLTLNEAEVRVSSDTTPGYPRSDGVDARFRDTQGPSQIAASSGLEDSGLFQLDLRDARFLPFEGRGAVGSWHIALSKRATFDWSSINDVVLHLRYTALGGGQPLADAANLAYVASTNRWPNLGVGGTTATAVGPRLGVSVRSEAPDAWHRFLFPAEGTARRLELEIALGRFPWVHQPGLTVTGVQVLVLRKPGASAPGDFATGELTLGVGSSPLTFSPATEYGPDVFSASTEASPAPAFAPGLFTFTPTEPDDFTDETLNDLVLLISYETEYGP